MYIYIYIYIYEISAYIEGDSAFPTFFKNLVGSSFTYFVKLINEPTCLYFTI